MGALSLPPQDRSWYRGERYASAAERDWAIAFDRLGIRVVRLDGSTRTEAAALGLDQSAVPLVPTFYLPASRQYVHVIPMVGVLRLDLYHQCTAFVAAQPPRPFTDEEEAIPDVRLVLVDGTGRFRGSPRGSELAASVYASEGLFQCRACGGWWFLDESMGWACQCCGAYDGDGHLSDARHEGRLRPFPDVQVSSWAA